MSTRPGGKGHRISDRLSSARHPRSRHPVAVFVALLALGVTTPAMLASSIPEQVPGTPVAAAPEGSGVAAQPVATAPVATPPAVTPPAVRPPATGAIAIGARGNSVKALQRKLRTRGIKIPVDGSYGVRTRAGVRILQRKLRLKVTGVADAALLRRLGLKVRVVASTRVTTTAQYLRVFPVVGKYSYSDDFGAPRSQGSHQGTDIMAAMGTQLVSCVDGTIDRLTRSETGLGGIWIWITDANGNQYYYAHMESISPELRAGSKVTAGQPVGTMGMTGDARGTTPHLHFEIRPSGGGSINPYSDLRAADPKK